MPQALVTCAGEPPSKVAIFSDDAELSWENAIFWRVSSVTARFSGFWAGKLVECRPIFTFEDCFHGD